MRKAYAKNPATTKAARAATLRRPTGRTSHYFHARIDKRLLEIMV